MECDGGWGYWGKLLGWPCLCFCAGMALIVLSSSGIGLVAGGYLVAYGARDASARLEKETRRRDADVDLFLLDRGYTTWVRKRLKERLR